MDILSADESPSGSAAIDVTLSNFRTEVLDASLKQVVIVDFWATWCTPCKQFGPILEKAVAACRGAVRLAKVDIDQSPQIAQQMNVQSVPAVFAFFRGQPVDGFMGGVPEQQLNTWLERLIKATGALGHDPEEGFDKALEQAATLLAEGEAATAQSIYADILDEQPENPAAYCGYVRCLLALGLIDQAVDTAARAPEVVKKDKLFEGMQTAVELAQQGKEAAGAIADFEKKVAKNPADIGAHYDLAMAYYAANKRDLAVDELLEIVRRDRKWNDDGARKQLVKFFEAFGNTDPLTVAGRKRLSSILFS